jgi:hypothetical protein
LRVPVLAASLPTVAREMDMKDAYETSEAGSEESVGSAGPTYEINVFDLDLTCDGLFLLVDSANHYGFRRSDEEIREHVKECEECFNVNYEVL